MLEPEQVKSSGTLRLMTIALCHYRTGKSWLDDNQAVEMIRTIGADRVLFGTDYPWVDPMGDIERIRSLNLTEEERRKILGENAARLLGLR